MQKYLEYFIHFSLIFILMKKKNSTVHLVCSKLRCRYCMEVFETNIVGQTASHYALGVWFLQLLPYIM
jgi:hypothetical protein